MPERPHRVCLIGPGAVSANPRLVKEADALHQAGYRVRVVSGGGHSLGFDLDQALVMRRGWRVQSIAHRGKVARTPNVLRRRLAARLAHGGGLYTPSLAAWGESELVGRLTRAAAAEPADLYIGHYLPGLYAAWKAARRHGAALGFDAEDSHVDELADTRAFAGRRAARQRLEGQLIAECRHLTAASPLIAEAYERRYGRRPTTILNVFPKDQAPAGPGATPHLAGTGSPTLYWFSQTAGPGRGLEEIVAAMKWSECRPELHIRGTPAANYRERLERSAREAGVAELLRWHPPAPADEMVRLAAGYDLGLASETGFSGNNRIAVSNKVFTYLLAGTPVLLSRTPGQSDLAEQLGPAGGLVDIHEPAGVARALDAWLGDKDRLARSRTAAWDLGQTRFNWDVEQAAFLDSVENALAATVPVY
jgi:glycosyltransferase involved in cell wall biosynthesis